MSLPDEAMKLKDGKIIYDQVASMIAVQYSEADSNPAGSYVIYNGSVYRLPNGHTANVSWANTEKEGPTNIYETVSEVNTELSSKANTANPVFTGSISMGRAENTTVGDKSTATGTSVTASGSNSHAEGGGTTASGNQAHAEGGGTTASGSNAHSEGAGSQATKNSAHAEGTGTTASGDSSHSEGNGTTASGYGAHAEGSGTTASGLNAHAEGGATSATSDDAHAEGGGTQANGSCAHAEGSTTRANGYSSHSEGGGTIANGSCAHAEGAGTTANGIDSHAEGGGTIANGGCSHAGGRYNVPDDYSSWAEWVANTNYAVGDKVKCTVTENNETTVTGHICKIPNNDSTFTSSKWNTDFYMNYAEIIGNGTSDNNRSNARTLDWDGNEALAGDLTVNKGTANEFSISALKTEINSMPTEETGQELLAAEFHNTGLTDTAIMVLGMILNAMPQDDIATDIMHSLSLECERLDAIYENWMSERSA